METDQSFNQQSVADLATSLQVMFGVEDGFDQPEDVTTLRYVIYARKSTDDSGKQERSIGDQIRACTDTAERMGLHVVDIVHEEKSAKLSDSRPKFREMLNNILNGKYDAILTWAPDRLARNMKDAGEVLDLLDRGDIKDIKFANGYYFQNDGAGKMMLGMAFVQAKQFIDTHSQNVKRGITRITAEGKFNDRPKHGYYKDAHGYPRPDGENWHLFKNIFEMRLSREPKHSLKEIAAWLKEQGYPIKTKHTERKPVKLDEKFLSNIFRDPFYAGVLIFGKQIVNLTEKFDFQPIINPTEFDVLAKTDGINKKFRLAEVIKPKGSIKADLLRGMVICGACGHSMSSGVTPKKTAKGVTHYYYFRCDTGKCKYKGKSVRAKEVLAAAYGFIENHPINLEKGYAAYKSEMLRLIDSHDAEILSRLKSLNKQYTAAKEQVRDTKDMLKQHASDVILVKEFKTDLKRHLAKQEEVEKAIVKLKKQREGTKDVIQSHEQFVELFGKLALNIQKISNMADLDSILKKVFMNFVVEGKIVTQITQNPTFEELCGGVDSAMVVLRGIEPRFSP